MKTNCFLIEPHCMVNGRLVKPKPRGVSRDAAANLLRACRQGQHQVLRIHVGRYSLLPDGMKNGCRLHTKA